MKKRCIGLVIKDQDPLLLTTGETVGDACRRMWERRVGAVLVVNDQGTLAGIFTGRDAVRILAEGHDGPDTRLAVAMTPDPRTIGPAETSLDALRAMSDGGYRHLPVVEGGRILGVVSRGDFNGVEFERLGDETSLWERIC
ncbi:CBS domain-containing protein [Methyloversatilis sp. XJ19-13]|uniref:CBS domain-containing protein n=1 Tax=Methyloversatilis sp. XJ19-13 TaxID=2963430 RepID=UPI00211BE366|nr:CBS domain-containing protein [Methyloversatilis sp. XJ19-13]MCQ9374623.1 CBS domain-containing protein [Methyloversatilis sp. XJ19-13]